MDRKFKSQLGKRIPDPGAHMPHVVVGLLRKRRKKSSEMYNEVGGSKVDPRKEYDPYPLEPHSQRQETGSQDDE